MNIEQDQLDQVVNIYLALHKDNEEELIHIMEERNNEIDGKN